MYSVNEIRPRIFHVKIDDPVRCAMVALRYSEYYESATNKGKLLPYTELVESYARSAGGVFSYPKDFVGFNLPDYVFSDLFPEDGKQVIPDPNQYDFFMFGVVSEIRQRVAGDNYYVLLTSVDKSHPTTDHELSHGFFYLSEHYRSQMTHYISKFKAKYPEAFDKFRGFLLAAGYDESVMVDEMSAYLATGWAKDMTEAGLPSARGIDTVKAECQNLFKKFMKETEE